MGRDETGWEVFVPRDKLSGTVHSYWNFRIKNLIFDKNQKVVNMTSIIRRKIRNFNFCPDIEILINQLGSALWSSKLDRSKRYGKKARNKRVHFSTIIPKILWYVTANPFRFFINRTSLWIVCSKKYSQL